LSNLLILGGRAGEHLAIRIAKTLNAELGEIEVKHFPDNEIYIRIKSDVESKDIIYINSLQRGPNDLIVETIYTLETIKELGARRIIAVIPYMAYARQDDRFNPGEAISIKILAKMFKSIGLDKLYTIDMHLHRITNPKEIFGEGFENLTAIGEIAKYIKQNHSIENSIVIGPDEESKQWAQIMAKELGGLEYDILVKRRITAEKVVIEPKEVDVSGRNVIIIDDIISTGGTIEEAVKVLRKLNARKLIVACVHPILVGRALPRLLRLNLTDLIGTDTILSPISKVSVAPVIVKAILKFLK